MKRQVGEIQPVPSKRIFYSIISDYDVNRSICELVDNAIDEWARNGKMRPLVVSIDLDPEQQTIQISDNAGGVARDEIEILVGPGYSTNSGEGATIGYFGVGTKRAVVALAQQITLKTCRAGAPTFLIEYDDSWLKIEDWTLPVYEVLPIEDGRTIVTLTRLRHVITQDLIDDVRAHLSATYALFLRDSPFSLEVNAKPVTPREFENWAYPPECPPIRFYGDLNLPNGKVVAVEATVGLSNESSPATGEYGAYWYCNGRLIARALKSHQIGFDRGNVGLPHPEISLLRAIIRLRGETQDMPWNSSKSGLNYVHPVFIALRNWLISALKEYAARSRHFVGAWEESVFLHKTGVVNNVFIPDFPTARKSYLPKIPSRPTRRVSISTLNKAIIDERPWIRGLLGGMSALPHLTNGKLNDGNRIALIVLDSTLEIAFKEYLVHETNKHYSDADIRSIFAARHLVHDEIKRHCTLTRTFWKKVNYYYLLRCKLIHERATVAIPDEEIDDFRQVVQQALSCLFPLKLPDDGT